MKEEYDDIYKKYQRRIERFRAERKKPTCFIRGVRTMKELSSIKEYEERITQVIKKHSGNQIIFIIPKYIYEANPIKFIFRHFLVDVSKDWVDREKLRSFFDSNAEWINFLEENYDNDKRKDNLIFDLRAELNIVKRSVLETTFYNENKDLKERISKLVKSKEEADSRNLRWMRLLNTDFDSINFPPQIKYIWVWCDRKNFLSESQRLLYGGEVY